MRKNRLILGILGIYLGVMALFLLYDGMAQAYDMGTMIYQMQCALGGTLFSEKQDCIMYAFVGLTFIAETATGIISLWCFVTTPSVKRLQGAIFSLVLFQILTIFVYVEWLSIKPWMFNSIHRIVLISILTWRWKKQLQNLDEAGEKYHREYFPFIRELIKSLHKTK